MTVVLLLLGMLSWTVSAAYDNTVPSRDRAIAERTGDALRETLRSYALRNARLPCPDTTGTGFENALNGGPCLDATQAGWLPYRTLGLDLPAPASRAAYAVYRNPAAAGGDADLAVSTERTGDVPGAPNYRNVRDLVVGLRNSANQPLSAGQVRITGDDAAAGPIDCAANVRSHPAFLLVVPLSDRDADGDRFDSIHATGSVPGVLCAYAPGAPLTMTQDDVVIAESVTALAGWLGARVP